MKLQGFKTWNGSLSVEAEWSHKEPGESVGLSVRISSGVARYTLGPLDALGLTRLRDVFLSDGDGPVEVPSSDRNNEYKVEVCTRKTDGSLSVMITDVNGEFEIRLPEGERRDLAGCFDSWAETFLRRGRG